MPFLFTSTLYHFITFLSLPMQTRCGGCPCSLRHPSLWHWTWPAQGNMSVGADSEVSKLLSFLGSLLLCSARRLPLIVVPHCQDKLNPLDLRAQTNSILSLLHWAWCLTTPTEHSQGRLAFLSVEMTVLNHHAQISLFISDSLTMQTRLGFNSGDPGPLPP